MRTSRMRTIAISTTDDRGHKKRERAKPRELDPFFPGTFAYWPMVTVPPRLIKNIGWVIVSRSL